MADLGIGEVRNKNVSLRGRGLRQGIKRNWTVVAVSRGGDKQRRTGPGLAFWALCEGTQAKVQFYMWKSNFVVTNNDFIMPFAFSGSSEHLLYPQALHSYINQHEQKVWMFLGFSTAHLIKKSYLVYFLYCHIITTFNLWHTLNLSSPAFSLFPQISFSTYLLLWFVNLCI